MSPRVSVVTATYNRSNVLRLAIASLRAQTVTDWELQVVGDGCTDDTADVVASFGDPRIHFSDAGVNHGEQSVPNNTGVTRASAPFLAFLNHDDLWFSDHLSTLLEAIESAGADLVYALSARIDARGRAHLWSASPEGRFEIWHSVPASTWLMRRELAARVGPWRSAQTLWHAPSQDWIRRAHAAGARLQPVRRLTVVQITSGARADSYRNRESSDHELTWQTMSTDPRYRERLLTDIAIASSPMATYVRPAALASRTIKAAAARVAVAAGVAPVVAFSALRYWRRGGFIRHLRRTRGLPAHGGERV